MASMDVPVALMLSYAFTKFSKVHVMGKPLRLSIMYSLFDLSAASSAQNSGYRSDKQYTAKIMNTTMFITLGRVMSFSR